MSSGAALVGWAAKAAVYAAVAWIVLLMALASAAAETSLTGAFEYLATTRSVPFALGVVRVGLLAHAIGRVLEVSPLAGPQCEARDCVVRRSLPLCTSGSDCRRSPSSPAPGDSPRPGRARTIMTRRLVVAIRTLNSNTSVTFGSSGHG